MNKEEKREYNKKYRQTHKEEIKEYGKQYYQKNEEKIKQYYQDHKEERKQYRRSHKEERKQYCQNHIEERRKYDKQYHQDHKEERKRYHQDHKDERNERNKIRLRTDLKYNLNNRMSNAIHKSLRNGSGKRGHRWETLVGYTSKQLKRYLKKTMPNGYSWQDYLEGRLHLDHIFPLSVFDITSPESLGFQRCWALDNL